MSSTALITNSHNLRYLIGFTGSSGFLLMGKKNYFFTDFRYKDIAKNLEKSRTRLKFEFMELDAQFTEKFEQIQKKEVFKMVEFESHHMSIDALKGWKKRFKSLAFKPIQTPIEIQRSLKDAEEIKKLKKSQQINEQTLDRIKKLLKPGMTELEIAWQIKVIGHELGAEDISFEPIVGFGPNSAIPHHQNSTRKLKAQDIVLIDMGMKFEGYCSDMTRTFFMGKPSAEQAHIYNKVLEAQEAAIRALKAGVACKKLDEIARQSMGEDAQHFGHSLGHGIGLEVHETPNLSSRSKDILKEGMVVTVEPGIYLSGKFGVRIEDMGQVTAQGYENFTKAPKELDN